jgi:5-formyltetrahydrofolate cyclo-ligase
VDKPSLRIKHLNLRKSLSAENHQVFSALIFKQLLSDLEAFEHIGIYISMAHEVDTLKIIEWCFKHKKNVYVPKILKDGMIFVKIHSLDECTLNRMGILEPISNQASEGIQLMIVPMLAFNERRHRLGYGRAYYDRYLQSHTCIKVGICYDANLEPLLIESNKDVQLDKILTEIRAF